MIDSHIPLDIQIKVAENGYILQVRVPGGKKDLDTISTEVYPNLASLQSAIEAWVYKIKEIRKA